jgi:hypothetical protein
MTEAEWLQATDPHEMLSRMGDRLEPRKLLLFARACAARAAHLIEDEVISLSPLDDMAESGHFDLRDVMAIGMALARAAGRITGMDHVSGYSTWLRWPGAVSEVALVARVAIAAARVRSRRSGGPLKAQRNRERRMQRLLLRDIAGNPFRPVAVNPAWLAWGDATVPKLAQALYDDPAFGRVAILADALEDAGCGVRALLDHLRGPGPHVRGCWVVDLLLKREGS